MFCLKSVFALFAALMLLFGCISSSPKTPALPPIGPSSGEPSGQMPGSDRDEHGCIGSAGYTWCEAKEKCIRPWEENCEPTQMDGSDRDEHGCIGSAGYVWCDEKQKCLRVWEEGCPSIENAALEEYAKTFCNQPNVANIYTCGQHVKVVSSLIGAGSKFYLLGNYGDPVTCPIVSPESMSEECRLLILGNNCVEKEVECAAPLVPAAITDLRDDPSFVGAQLTWTKPDENAVDYEIYRADDGFKTVSLLTTTGQTAYNDVFDGGNATYAYFVRARNVAGQASSFSNIVYVAQLSTTNRPSPGQIN